MKVARKWPRDINTEIVTKWVAVSAASFSIGAFCTEFRCESIRDEDIFRIGFQKSAIRVRKPIFFVRGSLNFFELQANCKKLTPIQKMSSSQSCSHRNSVQNAPIEKFTALTATLFVTLHEPEPELNCMNLNLN